MVRGFGVLLAVGVGIALLCAFTAGAAALVLVGGGRAGDAWPARACLRVRPLAAAWRGARELLLDNPVNRVRLEGRAGRGRAPARRGCCGVGLALAALGWGLDTQTKVETDITKLVPQNLELAAEPQRARADTGVGGEIDLMVRAQGPGQAGDDRMDALV